MSYISNQLARWVLFGKHNYWFQGRLLPKEVLDKVKSIVYSFVWDRGRGARRRKMAKEREESGLGLKDIRQMGRAATVKRIVRIWTSEQSIWGRLMRDMYVRGRALTYIQPVENQSTVWSDILRLRE